MSNTDPIYQLYTQICEGGLNLLEQWKSQGVAESEVLDFKLAQKGGTRLYEKDLGNLAKALSGFANSAGGVLVWGVECKRNPEDVDQITSLKPLTELNAFHSSVLTNWPQLAAPPPEKLEMQIIETAPGSNEGMLALYVPKGDAGPVMAMGSGMYRYYFRSGPSFLPMPEWMVADRYGRRPQPKLDLVWKKLRSEFADSTTIVFQLGLINNGSGVAKDMCVRLDNMNREVHFDYLKNTGFWQSRPAVAPGYPEEPEPIWFNTEHYTILPELVGVFAEIVVKIFSRTDNFLSFDYEVICEGAPKVKGTFKQTLGQFEVAEKNEWRSVT